MSDSKTDKPMAEPKLKPNKCLGKDRNMNPCRCLAIAMDNRFCKNHQYLNDYTDEQLETLSICSGCKKVVYLDGKKTCEKCSARGKGNREQYKSTVVKCALEKCNSKKSDQNKYCMLHQVHVWLDEVHESGHNPCTQYIRGCRNTMPIGSDYKKCEDCRQLEREKDQKKRDNAIQQNRILTDETSAKYCNSCGNLHPREYFVGDKMQETVTCRNCRENDKLQNTRRDKEHRRKQGREYDAKESRKKSKKEWKAANWEKVVQVWRNYRIRQREKDETSFLKKNAEYAKEWRTKNPDIMQAQYEKNKKDQEYQYNVYAKSAKYRSIPFEISIEDYKLVVNNQCYYCGIVNEKRGFHGMDRKNNNMCYNMNNVVSCCSMCNFIKGTLPVEDFLQRVTHILSYNEKIHQKVQYPDAFQNYNGTTYYGYKRRAQSRNLCFELTEEYFTELTFSSCYLCGKVSENQHRNGVDRRDNTNGYTIENSSSCCGGCNYMKNVFSLNSFFDRLMCIYNHQQSI